MLIKKLFCVSFDDGIENAIETIMLNETFF